MYISGLDVDDDNEEEEFWGKLDDEEVENYDSSEESSPNCRELDKSSSRRPSSRNSRLRHNNAHCGLYSAHYNFL